MGSFSREIADTVDYLISKATEIHESKSFLDFAEETFGSEEFGFLYKEYDLSKPHILANVLNVSLVSTIARAVHIAILADGIVEPDELERAVEILGGIIGRYTNVFDDDYGEFEFLDEDNVEEFLIKFTKDGRNFGGEDEAPLFTFRHFAKCTSLGIFLLDSTKDLEKAKRQVTQYYDVYGKLIEKIMKYILASGGLDPDEKKKYDLVIKMHQSQKDLIYDLVKNIKDESEKESEKEKEEDDEDEETETPEVALKKAVQELDTMIGLPEVKTEVRKLMNFLNIQKQRITHGLKTNGQSLHFVFKGNPGTGKTTVARIICRVLFGFGILKKNLLVETDRSTLIAGYVGQTAIKTAEEIAKAMDGVFFIDEAYTLSPTGGGSDYGKEAIDTILKKMEDLRDRLVVIAAGYPAPMDEFLSANPGLESRFTRFIYFDDYSVADMCRIFEQFCKNNQYSISQMAKANLFYFFNGAFSEKNDKFGNGRFVRNVYEKALGHLADRLSESQVEIKKADLTTIDVLDIPFEMLKTKAKKIDFEKSIWLGKCPGCNRIAKGDIKFLGQRVTCKCTVKFVFPWWNLDDAFQTAVGIKKLPPGKVDDLLGIKVSGQNG